MKQTFKKLSAVLCTAVVTGSLLFGTAAVSAEEEDSLKEQITLGAEQTAETIITMSDEDIESYLNSGDEFAVSALQAWVDTKDELGAVKEDAVYEAEITEDDGEYIAVVPVSFEKYDADFTFIVDPEAGFTSMTIDVDYPLSVYMKGAAQNTIIGIATVFVMLLFLSFIISLFKFIPSGEKKKTAPAAPAPAAPVAAAPAAEQTADDTELIAVIAAAIAAAEGQTSTDGFVVRSIRKVNKKW
ncbi:MAG: OadG family protein [Blautia sp.]|nr:OadG family protein [Blautia sp.]MDY5032052.1 OadG family protein [Blautia sp.]